MTDFSVNQLASSNNSQTILNGEKYEQLAQSSLAQSTKLVDTLTININSIPSRKRLDKSQLPMLQSKLREKETLNEQEIYSQLLQLDAEYLKIQQLQSSVLDTTQKDGKNSSELDLEDITKIQQQNIDMPEENAMNQETSLFSEADQVDLEGNNEIIFKAVLLQELFSANVMFE